jgi:HK97 family phage prohead protease
MREKPTTSDIERRAFNVDGMRVEKRADTEQRLIVGHAAVFNAETDIGGYFMERVAPGAFARAIKEDDVRSLFNHDANFVLGRTKAGTLKLREDGTGLMTETTPPDTQFARDLQISIARGDISQMSFGFRVKGEAWEERSDGKWLRTITDVELFDISPVTFPAYPTTDVGLRSLNALLESRGKPIINPVLLARRETVQRIREKS